MTLEDEISEAQSYATDPPKNESNTCEQIILPILWAAGYARREVVSRTADSTGLFPDYTLLPNQSSATYYLEAKAWNVALEDKHVTQALDYANRNGKRFVVLTNGRDWRLYDNTILGVSEAKLIAHAPLHETPKITHFLTMLSKPQVLQGSLERAAEEVRQRRLQQALDLQEQQRHEEKLQKIRERQLQVDRLLNDVLPALLSDPNSEVIVLLAGHLNQQEAFKDVLPDVMSAWFAKKSESTSEGSGRPDHFARQRTTLAAVPCRAAGRKNLDPTRPSE